MYDAAEEKRAAAPLTTVTTKPGKKESRSSFSEVDVSEVINEVCHRRKKGGEWLWYTDLVEVGGSTKPRGVSFHRGLSKAEQKSEEKYLLVAETEEPGKWDHEKATLRRACEEVGALTKRGA